MKPFLVLQLRPETEASDNEYEAILKKGGLQEWETHRLRLDLEPLPPNLDLHGYAAIIVGGGPGCISDSPERKSPIEKRIEESILGLMPAITEADFPFLGCCYGIGILAHHLGARVGKERYGESVGSVACDLTSLALADPLFTGVPKSFTAFVGHKEAVQELPAGCVHLVSSDPCPYQMIRYGSNVYATQFHPEADGEGFELRIRIYRDRGYFPPEEADELIAMCRAAEVRFPQLILRNFVNTHR